MISAEQETYQAAWQSLADKSEQLGLLSEQILAQIISELQAKHPFSPAIQNFLQAVISQPNQSADHLKHCKQQEIQSLHQSIEQHYSISQPESTQVHAQAQVEAESMELLDFDAESFEEGFEKTDDDEFELLAFDAIEETPEEAHRKGLYLVLQILMAHYYIHFVAEKTN